MAILIPDTEHREESLCWTCEKGYALKCTFHGCPDDYTWEERLQVPSVVGIKDVGITTGVDGTRKTSKVYKVLECSHYKRSGPRGKNLKGTQWENIPIDYDDDVPTIKKQVKKQKEKETPKTKNKCIICSREVNGDVVCPSPVCLSMGSALGIRIKRRAKK